MSNNQRDTNGIKGADRTKGVALGAGVGIIIGAALSNPEFGMVLGAALGLIAGPTLVRKFK